LPNLAPGAAFIQPLTILKDPVAFPERWRTCVRHVSDINNLGWIIGRFYANAYFSEKGKLLGEALVKYVKQQYEKSIKALDWLEAPVKAVALQKLEKLYALMGFPDHVRMPPSHALVHTPLGDSDASLQSPVNVTDPAAVLHFYDGVNITNSYFGNIWTLIHWGEQRDWDKLGTPYDREEWAMTSQTVNA
jgi:endothelin-converting enzyme